jgi:rhamnosyltransferase
MPRPVASILIPTKNAGPRLREVLVAVEAQTPGFPFEVLVVDSGSSDGTLETVRAFPDVRLIEIPADEFGHGRTRNFAATHAEGDYLVYITHDAIPAGEAWLARLVEPFGNDEVAGVFGRHVPHVGADAFVQRDLKAHFDNIASFPPVLSKATDPDRYAADLGWRQLLHFFSNNNSALRRSVWESHPFPDVHFSEDQLWARQIIEAGYSKAYANDAIVAHSHRFGMISQLHRAFDEAAAFEKLFGYRMSSTVYRTLRTAIGFSARDIAYGWRNRVPLETVIGRVGQDIGLALGHFLGTHNERLSPKMRQALSHDQRLMQSLRRADR